MLIIGCDSSMNKQAGVLGATSLVGEELLRQMTQQGWHITAFSRDPRITLHPQIEWRGLKYQDSEKKIVEKKDIPFWLCVAPIWVLPAYFDLLLSFGARRIVVLSSTSRFTKHTSCDMNEQKIAGQIISGEEQVQSWASAHHIDWIILRPTLIYGYGRDKNIAQIARFIQRFKFFPVFGSAQGLRQPIHAADVAAACLSALNSCSVTDHCYDLTGGETISYREMVTRIFKALDYAPRIITIPLWVFHMVLWGLHWLPRYRHWTVDMAKRMNQDLIFDDCDTKRDLNIFPRSFSLTANDLPSQNG